MADIRYHDEFKLVESDKKLPLGRNPWAAAASTPPAVDWQGKQWNNLYEWLSKLNLDSVKWRWRQSLTGNGFCPICHFNTGKHAPAFCPLLAKLNLKLIRVSSPAADPPAAAPAPASSPSPGRHSAVADQAPVSGLTGSANASSGLVAMVAEEYDLDDNFRWDGDEFGIEFSGPFALPKSNNDSAIYYPSCNHRVIKASPPPLGPLQLSCPNHVASSSTSIVLSKTLTSIIKRMSTASILPKSGHCFTIADSGTTNHMFPDKSAFNSYKLVRNLQVCMGNNLFLLVLGCGLAIISLNGQRVLVRNALHVPGLVVPLYSLRAHCVQPGCGFIGASGVGILVYFPTFVLTVDTSKDCHLIFESLGRLALLDSLHYVQPRCVPSLYPSELASHIASKSPTVIEDDSSASDGPDVLTWSYPQPKCPARPLWPSSPTVASWLVSADLDSVSAQLHLLAEMVSSLQHPAPKLPPGVLTPSLPQSSPVLASTMSSKNEIISLLHRVGSSLPSVRPCDMENNSDTKTHWMVEELHRAMGCRKFWNYKTLLQVSCDGKWIHGGEFPPSLGSFATIPKAKRGLPLDKTKYFYLDAIHMDVAFGDCLSVGGYKYALILVDLASRYNWTFSLKLLSSDCILSALQLFRVSAGGLAHCFYCDCNAKLFGTAILEYLIDNHSKVVAALAKCQSSNGLVEFHWKIMVHMAWENLIKKQMPRSFWFYAITHTVRMMNTIPGKFKDRLALPFMLVHGVRHDVRTWTPLFSLCYFHHKKNSDDMRRWSLFDIKCPLGLQSLQPAVLQTGQLPN